MDQPKKNQNLPHWMKHNDYIDDSDSLCDQSYDTPTMSESNPAVSEYSMVNTKDNDRAGDTTILKDEELFNKYNSSNSNNDESQIKVTSSDKSKANHMFNGHTEYDATLISADPSRNNANMKMSVNDNNNLNNQIMLPASQIQLQSPLLNINNNDSFEYIMHNYYQKNDDILLDNMINLSNINMNSSEMQISNNIRPSTINNTNNLEIPMLHPSYYHINPYLPHNISLTSMINKSNLTTQSPTNCQHHLMWEHNYNINSLINNNNNMIINHNVKKQIHDEIMEMIQHNQLATFATNQHGSRLIQQYLEQSNNVQDIDLIFTNIKHDTIILSNDIFGNYIIQQLLQYGNKILHYQLTKILQSHILLLTNSAYGCRVIQKALECIENELKIIFFDEIKFNLLECIYNHNGNHAIRKMIEQLPLWAV